MPAINPEARWSIENAIQEAMRGCRLNGAIVSISAINGEDIAKRTLNEKVGVLVGSQSLAPADLLNLGTNV